MDAELDLTKGTEELSSRACCSEDEILTLEDVLQCGLTDRQMVARRRLHQQTILLIQQERARRDQGTDEMFTDSDKL